MLVFDDNGYRTFLTNVKPSKLRTAFKSGLRKSLNIIKKRAKVNLKQVTSRYNKPDRWGHTLQGGIVVVINKDAKAGRVEIITRSKEKNNFKLKFFENGTVGRSTKKGAYRGKMKATHFFSSASDSIKSEVEESLQKNLEDSLKKAFEKFAK